MERDATSLKIACALVLISETVRFWSDDQRDLCGGLQSPRCLNPTSSADLLESLKRINLICTSALRTFDEIFPKTPPKKNHE